MPWKNRPLEEYDVDVEYVRGVVEGVTKALDEKLDACNKDPGFKHPLYPDDDPIRKSGDWPGYLFGRFFWRAWYKPGNSKSSRFMNVCYIPNPQKYYELREVDVDPETAKKDQKEIMNANSVIDLSRGVFHMSDPDAGRLVASNKFEDLIPYIDRELELLAESRTAGV